MATTKMTFTLPAPVATQLTRQIGPRQRSNFVTEAIAARLAERERQLIVACDAVNADPDIESLEADFGALPDSADEAER